jgi:hypothetical protein
MERDGGNIRAQEREGKGTREVNALMIGQSGTGIGAF